MHAAAGDVPADWKQQHPEFTPQTLFKYWQDYPHKESSPLATQQSGRSNAAALKAYKPRQSATILTVFLLVLKRAWVQHSRSKMGFLIDNALVFIASLFLGLVYYGYPVFTAPEPTEV